MNKFIFIVCFALFFEAGTLLAQGFSDELNPDKWEKNAKIT